MKTPSIDDPTPDIVATLGPMSWDLAADLMAAGATALRVNASHVEPASLPAIIESVLERAPGTKLVVDLQGAKMRLGRFEPRDLVEDEEIELRLGMEAVGATPVPHPELFDALREGDSVTIDDGRLIVEVTIRDRENVRARVLRGGPLLPRKGVNILDHPLLLDDLTAEDRVFIERATERIGCDAEGAPSVAFAYSFMLDGREAGWVRSAAPGAKIIGKVERGEAVGNLEAIAGSVDEIWICRGDLGEQLGLGGLARFVGKLDPRSLEVPVLMAGQVLHHLTEHRRPTRSEVCHLYNLMKRGYAGIVLSDETAVGVDPVRAVGIARRLLAEP